MSKKRSLRFLVATTLLWSTFSILSASINTADTPTFAFCRNYQWCNDAQQCSKNATLQASLNASCTSGVLLLDARIDFDQDGTIDLLAANISPYPYPNPDALPVINLEVTAGVNANFDLNLAAYDFPIGKHQVFWRVADGCGGTGACDYFLMIKDCEGPEVMAADITAFIVGGGNIDDCFPRFTPDSLDLGSSDNCGIKQRLLAVPSLGPGQTEPCNAHPSFSLGHFDYVYTAGTPYSEHSYDLWVEDVNGNWSYDSGIIYLGMNDIEQRCSLEGTLLAEGLIRTEDHRPIQGVKVWSKTDSFPSIGYSISNGIGAYRVVVSGLGGHPYYFGLELNKDADNGVSTLDLILISRHLIGLQTLDSPYKLLAADVDNSGSLSVFDLLVLQKLILHIDTSFTNNTSWRFLPENFVFSDPTHPWNDTIPPIFDYNDVDQRHLDFIGIKVGDVSLDAATCLTSGTGDRQSEALFLSLVDQHLEAEKEYTVSVQMEASKALLGYQLAFAYDVEALELRNAASSPFFKESSSLPMQSIEKGIIKSNWYQSEALEITSQTPLVQLQFKALKNGYLSEYFQLDNALSAEAYDPQLAVSPIQLVYTESSQEDFTQEQLRVYAPFPNPIHQNTLLPFYLPKRGMVQLHVFDARGQLVAQKQNYYEAGNHQMAIERSLFLNAGLYYLQIQNGETRVSTKVMVVD